LWFWFCCLYCLFLNDFDDVFQYSTFNPIFIIHMHRKWSKEILSLNIDLPMKQSLQLFHLIPILMLTSSLNNKHLLISKWNLYNTRPFNNFSLWSNFTIFICFIEIVWCSWVESVGFYGLWWRLYMGLWCRVQHVLLILVEIIIVRALMIQSLGILPFFSFFLGG